jgi:hypothetical protein
MVDITSMAEELISDYSSKQTETPTETPAEAPITADAPAKEVTGEVAEVKVDDKTPAEIAYEHQWRGKALEFVRNAYKDSADYSTKLKDDRYAEDIAFMNAVKASEKIQKEVELRKSKEAEYEPYRKFYSEWEANPLVQQLYNGKAKIVPLEQLNSQVDEDETPAYVNALQQKLQAIEAKLENNERLSAQEKHQLQQANEMQIANQTVEKEEQELSGKYPEFKKWIDVYNKSGGRTPEFEDVLDIVEKEGVTLKRAVQSYLFEKGLPAMQIAAKQQTITTMKAKAKNNTESNSSIISKGDQPDVSTANISDIAQMLINDAKSQGKI